MKFLTPAHRRMLPAAIFAMTFFHVLSLWAFARFLHRDAQYRSLSPEHYEVQVVTAEDYRRLADPAARTVRLSGGVTLEKADAWERLILPNYKPAPDGKSYVLVTTKGTAHFLSYVEPQYLVLGFFALCGLAASVWNLGRVDDSRQARAPLTDGRRLGDDGGADAVQPPAVSASPARD